MLILTRKRSETIQIGDDVLVKVIRTGRGSVKLGIIAPDSVRVLRGELSEREAEEKQGQLPDFSGRTPAAKSLSVSQMVPRPSIA